MHMVVNYNSHSSY